MRYLERAMGVVVRATLAIAAALAYAGCEEGPSSATTEQRGDTLFVFANGPPTLPTRVARVDLRVGALDGDPNLSFGRLEYLTVLPSGGFAMWDDHFMRVSRFDATGQFLGEYGRRGQGPGEFRYVFGLGGSPDGCVYLYASDGRVLRFGEDGDYTDEWRLDFRLSAGDPFVPLADSLLVLKILEQSGSLTTPSIFGFVTVDARGEDIDSTGPIPYPWSEEITRGYPGLASMPFLAWSPAGFYAAGVTGRFAVEVHPREGGVVRIERRVDPVPFLKDEWQEWEEHNEFMRRRSGDPPRYPTTPEHKPPIRGVFLPPNGEIWIQRSTLSVGPDPGHLKSVAGLQTSPEWLEPLLFEVFEPNGTYLGAVEGPVGVDVRAVSENAIWGYVNGTYGEQYVVRLKIDMSGR